MTEQEKKPGAAAGRKKNNYRFGQRSSLPKSNYKSKIAGLEDDTFDVGASSDPAKFSKSLKSIETYVQRTYKMPDDIVKAIQQMERPTLISPKPLKSECTDNHGVFDEDEYDLAKFAWKENYKAAMKRKEKYDENESNAWALIYDQCSPELKNKLEGASGYESCKKDNDVVSLLTMIRGYCCQFDTLNDEYVSIVGAIKNLYTYFRGRTNRTPTTTKTSWQ